MARFRKRPVVVEAVQWIESNLNELQAFGAPVIPVAADSRYLIIETLEDGPDGQVTHAVTPGDWIIRGVNGEYYACKPDIFEATYEAE